MLKDDREPIKGSEIKGGEQIQARLPPWIEEDKGITSPVHGEIKSTTEKAFQLDLDQKGLVTWLPRSVFDGMGGELFLIDRDK